MVYQVCNRCVMDNLTDSDINFDSDGFCNYCNNALNIQDKVYFPNKIGEEKFNRLIEFLKREGKGKKYDCIMGLSGGLDSAYLAYLGHKNGLRILSVHINDGFNTPLADENNQKIVDACNLDYINVTPDRFEYFDLTKAFIKAGVPNIAIPQDNIIFGYMHEYAKKYKIKHFLSGYNFPLESILQTSKTHSAFDRKHIVDINKKFGTTTLNNLHITSVFRRDVIDKINGIKVHAPLNYIDYNREEAIQTLKDFCGYNYYGGKHYESYFTKVMQAYYLPNKFNVDKRKSHLSSMIISGQITRLEALEELSLPLYSEEEISHEIEIVLELLNITKAEFSKLMTDHQKKHIDYKTYTIVELTIIRILRKIANLIVRDSL